MIRAARITDLDDIEETYYEHFAYEKKYGAHTVFREGIYPTRKDAERALQSDELYVYEENGIIMGSIVLNNRQPEEYKQIDWPGHVADEKVKVIHLLMVRPDAAGRGIGTALINFAFETAEKQSCAAIRLDTGSQNIPAAALYKKMGFQQAAVSSMKVGGTIYHEGHLFFEKRIRQIPAIDG